MNAERRVLGHSAIVHEFLKYENQQVKPHFIFHTIIPN